MVGELHQLLFGLGAVELAVEAHALLRRVDVIGGEAQRNPCRLKPPPQ